MADKDNKDWSKKFYDVPEEEMQNIVMRAQTGSPADMGRLIEIFENFLTKYVNIIYYGRFSLDDQDVRKFLSLFIGDSSLRLFTLRNTLTLQGRKSLNDLMSGIKYMVQRYGDIEDVSQTVRMSFIQCVNRYQRKGTIPFSGYIYSYFLYVLKKDIDNYLIDQLGLKTFPLVTDRDDYEDKERQPGYYAPIVDQELYNLILEDIDEHWVTSSSALPPFNVLSPQQRQLVRWRYVLGENTTTIANRISEHPNTCREHFKRIRQLLLEAMENDVD